MVQEPHAPQAVLQQTNDTQWPLVHCASLVQAEPLPPLSRQDPETQACGAAQSPLTEHGPQVCAVVSHRGLGFLQSALVPQATQTPTLQWGAPKWPAHPVSTVQASQTCVVGLHAGAAVSGQSLLLPQATQAEL